MIQNIISATILLLFIIAILVAWRVNFHNLYLKIVNNANVKYINIAAKSFAVFLILFLILFIVLKIIYAKQSDKFSQDVVASLYGDFNWLLKGIDVIGVIGSLLSIFAAIYVTVILQAVSSKENKDSFIHISARTSKLSEDFRGILDDTNRLYDQIKDSNRKLITSFPEILNEAKQIVSEADSDLYIITYSASFGAVSCFVEQKILEGFSDRVNETDPISTELFCGKQSELLREVDNLSDIIRKKIDTATVYRACLAQDKYYDMFLKFFLLTEKWYIIDKSDETIYPTKEVRIVCQNDLKVNYTQDNMNNKKNAQEHLEYLNKEAIRLFNTKAKKSIKPEVVELEEIPIQFFIGRSGYDNSAKSFSKQKCLVILANKYNFGERGGALGFVTENEKIITSYVKMYNKICEKLNVQTINK